MYVLLQLGETRGSTLHIRVRGGGETSNRYSLYSMGSTLHIRVGGGGCMYECTRTVCLSVSDNMRPKEHE